MTTQNQTKEISIKYLLENQKELNIKDLVLLSIELKNLNGGLEQYESI
jgi:hypothetical protein